jgi:hypothetical protein
MEERIKEKTTQKFYYRCTSFQEIAGGEKVDFLTQSR